MPTSLEPHACSEIKWETVPPKLNAFVIFPLAITIPISSTFFAEMERGLPCDLEEDFQMVEPVCLAFEEFKIHSGKDARRNIEASPRITKGAANHRPDTPVPVPCAPVPFHNVGLHNPIVSGRAKCETRPKIQVNGKDKRHLIQCECYRQSAVQWTAATLQADAPCKKLYRFEIIKVTLS